MAKQEYILFNNQKIAQPDADGWGYSWETTYSSDSGRTQSGKNYVNPLFTVEQFKYAKTNLTVAEVRQILQIIARGRKFRMHYFSPFYGKWRDDDFYVGKGDDINLGSLKAGAEKYESISFNITGVNPL